MAASASTSKVKELSKAEYLKRYLSTGEDTKKTKGKIKKKRPKVQGRGLKIVDDDIDWRQIAQESEEKDEEDEDEAPVIAEVIDDRPEEVKRLEVFRSGNRWKVIGADENEDGENGNEQNAENSEPAAGGRTRHDSPDTSPPRRFRHDSPDNSPPRSSRHNSPNISPPKRHHQDSPDLSLPRHSGKSGKVKELSPTRNKTSLSQKHPPKHHRSSPAKKTQKTHDSDSDQLPPRKKTIKREASDSDQSPPRRRTKARQDSDSDQSPPRKRPQGGKSSDEDLSPPRRPGQPHGHRMLCGGKAGLVSVHVLRKEREENRRRDRNNQPLEAESRNAKTVFRDKSGKRRDLESEREDQKKKAGEQAAKDEKYAQWGRGLAQGQMHQQRLEDALIESQKPFARHYDDEDLDKMLREQERDGDPMAAMLRRKKDRNLKSQGVKAKPQYKGPAPPPNRFNIPPGYRWDGVDRSNGFEQKRYSRIADKKALQEEAYKWSVEDM